jgi:hypothetical protein
MPLPEHSHAEPVLSQVGESPAAAAAAAAPSQASSSQASPQVAAESLRKLTILVAIPDFRHSHNRPAGQTFVDDVICAWHAGTGRRRRSGALQTSPSFYFLFSQHGRDGGVCGIEKGQISIEE